MLPKGNIPSHVHLNGEILPVEQAKISVFDRGFLFGDGIYEVMVQLQNGIFYKKAHIDRLRSNLNAVGIPYDLGEIDTTLESLLEASGLGKKDALIYIQLSRGTAPRSHAFPQGVPPTVMMYALPLPLPYINTQNLRGMTLADQRWELCHIKSTSLLANTMANTLATRAGSVEAVLFRDGLITEGSHTNVFFVKNGKLFTHPANHNILNGITRKIVLELCRELDIEVIEKAVAHSEMTEMDEAFLTGTTTQIASLAQLDGHVYHAPGNIGPVTRKLQSAFAILKDIDSSELEL